MSSHLALPREGHLEQVYHIFGYLQRNPKLRLMYDCKDLNWDCSRFKRNDWFDFYGDVKEAIPPNMPEARGLPVSISCFVDADLVGYICQPCSNSLV